MGHYMTNNATGTTTESAIGLESFNARNEVKRIADAVVDRTVSTTATLFIKCDELADARYTTLADVYDKVWQRVKSSPELRPTHPAGKTEAYHFLRRQAGE
jgi:hypothetical protein